MTDDELLAAAIDVAEEALGAGELPIGAVVAMGDDVVGRAFTRERGLGRRLVHADLLAMTQSDERLGRSRRPRPLVLAVNLEPCLTCFGAAMSLGVGGGLRAGAAGGRGGSGGRRAGRASRRALVRAARRAGRDPAAREP